MAPNGMQTLSSDKWLQSKAHQEHWPTSLGVGFFSECPDLLGNYLIAQQVAAWVLRVRGCSASETTTP